MDSFFIDNIGFIKIDVEDNEFQTLQFSEHTLRRSNFPKILFEMNKVNNKLLELLKSYDYTIININNYPNMFLADKKIEILIV